MKTMISTFFILLLSLTNLSAQENIVLDDFESGLVGFTTEVHINPDASFAILAYAPTQGITQGGQAVIEYTDGRQSVVLADFAMELKWGP